MTERETRARLTLLVVLVAMSAPSCTLTLPYPAPSIESCVGGVDDDFDGATDCDDSDCWGQCPEETRAACANERDDDGDGYADQFDPQCWPFASITVDRCQSVVGTSRTLGPADEVWVDESVEIVADPGGSPSVVAGVTAEGAGGRRRSADRFSGAWAGTTIRGRVFYGVPIEFFASLTVRLGDVTMQTTVDLMGNEVVFVGTSAGERSSAPAVPPGWRSFELRVVAETDGALAAEADVVRPDGTMISSRATLAGRWSPATAADLVVEFSGPAFVDSLEIVRPSFDPCGRTEPRFTPGYTVSAAMRSPDEYCVLWNWSTWRSPDGENWTEGPAPEPFLSTVSSERPQGVTWDPVQRLYRGAIRLPDGAVGIATSPSCVAWEIEGPAIATDSPEAGALTDPERNYAMGHLRRETGMGVRDEVWLLGTAELLRASSTTGRAGTFAGVERIDLTSIAGIDPTLTLRDITAVGADRIYTAASTSRSPTTSFEEEAIHFYVESRSMGLVEIPGLRLEPSGAPGTFDETMVWFGQLLLSTPDAAGWTGRVVINGSNFQQGDATQSGTELAAVRVRRGD